MEIPTAENQPPERREKIWWVSRDRLIPVFRGQLEIQGFPRDARIVAVTADWRRQCIGILIASQTFDPVPDGAEIQPLEDPGIIKYMVVAEPAFKVTDFSEPGGLLDAFLDLSRYFEDLGNEDPAPTTAAPPLAAWEVLKGLLRPVCFYAKEGTERLESPGGKVKFREFI